jgi:hypothetical protein
MTRQGLTARVLQRAAHKAPDSQEARQAWLFAPEWITARYDERSEEAQIELTLAYIAQKYPNAVWDSARAVWIGVPLDDPNKQPESADPSAQPEYAPKGTDEVAPTDEPIGDGDIHGGDNASQEVADGESAGGEKPSETGQHGQPRKRGSLSSRAYYSVETGYRVSASVIARAARVLTEWLSGSGLEQSPRWDAAQLAWRLKALSGIQRARRAELGAPSLMILADVSASCRGFAPRALTAAYAIYELQRLSVPMCIVTHSNGEPEKVLTPDRRVRAAEQIAPLRDRKRENYPTWYVQAAQKFGTTHVLALGDDDAEPTYIALAKRPSVEGLIWLDHYACNLIEPKIDKRWRCTNAVRVIGCKDENSLLTGLQIGIKALK